MRPGSAGARLLPPRPRPVDWIASGLSAGLMLAFAELLLARILGPELPARLGLLIACCEAFLVAIPAALLPLVLRWRRVRTSHSAMVGGVVGALCAAVVLSSLLGRVTAVGTGLAAGLAWAGGLGLCGMAGFLAAWWADRVELHLAPVSRPLVWGGAALLMASSAALRAQGLLGSGVGVASLAGLLVGLAVFGVLAREWVQRRGNRPVASSGRILALVVVAVLLIASWSHLAPWVAQGQDAVAMADDGLPNLLLVALSEPAGISGEPEGDLLHTRALAREQTAITRLVSDAEGGVERLLLLPGGVPLLPRLAARGYVIGAILRQSKALFGQGFIEVDDRPGGRRLLEGPLSWSAAAPLLLGPGLPLLHGSDLDAALRSPEELAGSTHRWLLDWRARRARLPFFLYVDLRSGTGSEPASRADSALGSMLDELWQLGIQERTLVLVAVETADGSAERGAGQALRVVVRPPANRPDLPLQPGVSPWVASEVISAALLEVASQPAQAPRLRRAAVD